MFRRFRPLIGPWLWAGLLALAALPAAAATDAAPAAQPAPQAQILLPAKPSELVRRPLGDWQPLLGQLAAWLDERARQAGSSSRAGLIEMGIQRTLLAQTRQAWPQVLEAVGRVRAQQDSESGRQMAGLLNEVLARQAIAGGDAAWLSQHVRDRVLAMPWAQVEPAVRSLRAQLAGAQVEAVETYLVRSMDLAAGMTQNKADTGFVFQLLGVRFQLLEVMPRRDALVAGLDDAIAQRGGAQEK